MQATKSSGKYVRDAVHSIARALDRRGLVVSVILIGSYARGDFTDTSDVDLVVITRRPLKPTKIREFIPKSAAIPRLSLLPYSQQIFRIRYRLGDLFIRHVVDEGEVVLDKGFYARLLREQFPRNPRESIRELDLIRKQLDVFEPKAFNNLYLDFLTQIYGMAVQAMIAAVMLRGNAEYNKRKVFKRFTSLYPELGAEARSLERLEPFSRVVKGMHPRLPFSPVGSSKEVSQSVESLRRVIDGVESAYR